RFWIVNIPIPQAHKKYNTRPGLIHIGLHQATISDALDLRAAPRLLWLVLVLSITFPVQHTRGRASKCVSRSNAQCPGCDNELRGLTAHPHWIWPPKEP